MGAVVARALTALGFRRERDIWYWAGTRTQATVQIGPDTVLALYAGRHLLDTVSLEPGTPDREVVSEVESLSAKATYYEANRRLPPSGRALHGLEGEDDEYPQTPERILGPGLDGLLEDAEARQVRGIQLTRRLKQGAEALSIRLLDHIIISPSGTFHSMSTQGQM